MTRKSGPQRAYRPAKGRPSSPGPAIEVAPLGWRPAATRATRSALLVTDVLACMACGWYFLGDLAGATPFLAALGAWLVLRAVAGLYNPVELATPEEMRRVLLTTVAAFVLHVALSFRVDQLAIEWRLPLLVWGAVLVVAWPARAMVKALLMRRRLYGAPVIVIGSGPTALALIDELQRNPEQGLYPVAVFDDDRSLRGSDLMGIPVVGGVEDAIAFRFGYDVDHVLVAMPVDDADRLRAVSDRFAARFSHVHVTPDFIGLANLWARARAVGPLVTLEFRHDRVTPLTLRFKRVFDWLLGAMFLVLAAPIIAVCAALVKLVSPGPAFFAQVREGHKGRLVRVWKIRTMVRDAEEQLENHLRESSAARREWAERMKLISDPRVIPGLGAFLRRWSLDELPQLWNVVNGSMSLVGPRPFPEYHLNLFPKSFREVRRAVPPGVTGLWQVSYRSDGDLSHQQAADSFYIHNWSLWLDLWILFRTIRVVFSGSGT